MRVVPILGNGGVIAEVNADGALNVTHRPNNYASNGVFTLSMGEAGHTGGLGGGSVLFAFRWTHATKLALVRQVSYVLSQDVQTASSTAQIDLFFARSFTASLAGGVTPTLTGDNNALRTSMAASQVGDVRFATSAGLSGGTYTLDALPLASLVFGFSATAQFYGMPKTDMINSGGEGSYPIVLAQNEGIIVRGQLPNVTYTHYITMKWAEVDSY